MSAALVLATQNVNDADFECNPQGAGHFVKADILALGQASGATSTCPYTQASPLGNGQAYTMKATDVVVYCAAGAHVTLPAAPLLNREYLVKVVSGSPEATPVQVFANGQNVEDPSAAAPYTFRSGVTPATMSTSGACNGWMSDGTVMNLTR